jgi:hypothetical protein
MKDVKTGDWTDCREEYGGYVLTGHTASGVETA